jgi:hypothetical protein
MQVIISNLEKPRLGLLSSLPSSKLVGADLIHVFSKLPRDLNFIDHTSDIGWKEYVLPCFFHGFSSLINR